ncbi:MAG: hypothetical protein M3N12_09605 [Verrucomicrobiota bacterium]|nr:hypothetical protein [Verrucomicrobiota bacterium]
MPTAHSYSTLAAIGALALIVAAGPLMNLFAGAVFWCLLRGRESLGSNWRLFFVLAMAFNLFWGAGYFIYSAVTDTGDWALVLSVSYFWPTATEEVWNRISRPLSSPAAMAGS